MSVTVKAVYDNNRFIDVESIASALNEKNNFFGAATISWNINGVFIENEEVPGHFWVGKSTIALSNAMKWVMFCYDTDRSYTNSIKYFEEFAAFFDSDSILFLPDSSFKESKAIDLLEKDCSIVDYEKYLSEIGSKRKEREDIIFVREATINTGSKEVPIKVSDSDGYIYYPINT